MDLPPDLSGKLIALEGLPLAALTTLGVGGPAGWVLEPRDRDELLLAVRHLLAAGVRFRFLGHGSNVLVSDAGLREVVVHTRSCRRIGRDERREHALRCDAGASLARVVSRAHELGLAGAEVLVGIPGTVGGAVVGNAGGRDGSIGDLLVETTVLCPDGALEVVSCGASDFGYRRSPFRGRIVLEACLQLRPGERTEILERMRGILREKSLAQPLSAQSAGCMFRNPPGSSSGRLIEEAGCKGLREGAALVSPLHANFILNTGGAAAADVARLVQRVRRRVAERFQVELELEVECWGEFGAG